DGISGVIYAKTGPQLFAGHLRIVRIRPEDIPGKRKPRNGRDHAARDRRARNEVTQTVFDEHTVIGLDGIREERRKCDNFYHSPLRHKNFRPAKWLRISRHNSIVEPRCSQNLLMVT